MIAQLLVNSKLNNVLTENNIFKKEKNYGFNIYNIHT